METTTNNKTNLFSIDGRYVIELTEAVEIPEGFTLDVRGNFRVARFDKAPVKNYRLPFIKIHATPEECEADESYLQMNEDGELFVKATPWMNGWVNDQQGKLWDSLWTLWCALKPSN